MAELVPVASERAALEAEARQKHAAAAEAAQWAAAEAQAASIAAAAAQAAEAAAAAAAAAEEPPAAPIIGPPGENMARLPQRPNLLQAIQHGWSCTVLTLPSHRGLVDLTP